MTPSRSSFNPNANASSIPSGSSLPPRPFRSLLKVIRTSEITQAVLTAVSGVFKIIKKLMQGEKKTDYVRVGIRSIMYVMVEKGGGDAGTFIKECVKGLIEEETRWQAGGNNRKDGKMKKRRLPIGEVRKGQ